MKLKTLYILSLFLFAACSSFEQPEQPVSLDKHSQYFLQTVPKNMWGQTTLQKLLITTPLDKHELLLQTELLPNKINMVGLSAAGLVLFKLTWSHELGLKIDTNLLARDINAQVMLAYYQLANWPMKEIQLGLKNLHIKLATEDMRERHFYRDDELIFGIQHNPSQSLMTHYVDHYQIEIKLLQQNEIDYDSPL